MGVDPEPDGFCVVFGIEVRDRDRYARYRSQMRPILEQHGGIFAWDFHVSRAERGEHWINRLFAIRFPDRAARERFFSDGRYRAVRREFFELSVGRVAALAEFDASRDCA